MFSPDTDGFFGLGPVVPEVESISTDSADLDILPPFYEGTDNTTSEALQNFSYLGGSLVDLT